MTVQAQVPGVSGSGPASRPGGGSRQARRRIRELLLAPDWQERLSGLDELPSGQVSTALLAALCDRDELIRMRAVIGLGGHVSRLMDLRPEEARILMRRLLWSLNEESGSIGWGAAEALGEVMARHAGLAREYYRLLISFIVDEGEENNFLELPELRRGAYWGLARLAEVRPELLVGHAERIAHGLRDGDPIIRTLACLALGRLGLLVRPSALTMSVLGCLRNDTIPVTLALGTSLVDTTVGRIAAEALTAIGA